MRTSLALLTVVLLLLGAACGDGSDGDADATPTTETTPTAEAQRTPVEQALLDEVIGLAVELDTMTFEQAICVFRDHPSIYQAFLQSSSLNESGTYSQAELMQQFEDLKREYAVQLDRCFTIPSG